jgi:predicted acylesterase/phospholipase RssA
LLKRGLKLFFIAAMAAILSGCVILGDKLDQFRWTFMTLPLYVFDNVPGYKPVPQPPVMEEEVNFAIAISGGGSRSAVFSSAVLEQLAYIPDPRHPGRTLLDGVDVISGVSGGSLSTAYFSTYKPADFSNQDVNVEFFQRYKSNMTTDFHMRGVAHYLTHPWEAVSKYYTRYRFVQTLGETFDQHIFKGNTMGYLHDRELAGEAPITLINATSMDTGKKFLFTNLNVHENWTFDPAQLIARLPQVAPSADRQGLTVMSQAMGTPIFQPFGFDAINSDIQAFRISHAVAASCAYPVIPGPAALVNYAQTGYIHLADGGINDNSGVDSVVGLYLGHLAKTNQKKRLVVLSINVASKLEPKETQDPDGYVSSVEYADRASSTLGTRAQTLATVLYNAPNSVNVIPINLTDASYHKQLDSGATMLAISERDALTLINAAVELVGRNRDRIVSAVK